MLVGRKEGKGEKKRKRKKGEWDTWGERFGGGKRARMQRD